MGKKNHNNDKVYFMIGQMANFKCGEGYYSTKYSSSYAKPKTWWQMVDDPNDDLKSLALKLFSITPHSVSCERNFSMLSFLYGKRRQCLSLPTVEMMAKIRSYLLSNTTNELNHLKREESEAELKILIQESGLFIDEDEDEGEELNNEDNDYYDVSNEIPMDEVYVLIINNMIDLSHSAFNGEFEGEMLDHIHNNDTSDNDNDDTLEEEELDFEVISRIPAPANM
jgi:hAT family protein